MPSWELSNIVKRVSLISPRFPFVSVSVCRLCLTSDDTIVFQRTLGNILLSGAVVSVMEPHYLSQTVLLSEWDWRICVCVPLGRLTSLADKRSCDNSTDNSMINFSKWLIRADCGVRDGKKTTKGVVSIWFLNCDKTNLNWKNDFFFFNTWLRKAHGRMQRRWDKVWSKQVFWMAGQV